MTEKIALRLFIIFMLGTATLAVTLIWGEAVVGEVVPKAMGTSFILGVASFIVWILSVFYRLTGPVLAALRGVAKE